MTENRTPDKSTVVPCPCDPCPNSKCTEGQERVLRVGAVKPGVCPSYSRACPTCQGRGRVRPEPLVVSAKNHETGEYERLSPPITDSEIEAAAKAWYAMRGESEPWKEPEEWKRYARAAIEAFLKARAG